MLVRARGAWVQPEMENWRSPLASEYTAIFGGTLPSTSANILGPSLCEVTPGTEKANAAPNAFGAQLAYLGRQTIALCGDGGFTMLGLGALLTQVQRKTPVVPIMNSSTSLTLNSKRPHRSLWRRL
jgi:pyruvate/2-oxoacid:ferredoxin oxidoreductase beta subunit